MFHHFHSDFHNARPGSLSSQDFSAVLDMVERTAEIVTPDEFFWGLEQKRQPENKVVLTFDDSLLSQFDVALPVLSERGLHACFAIYSSVYTGTPGPLEIFATFRQECFDTFDDFWREFASLVSKGSPKSVAQAENAVLNGFLDDFPFYSREERLFRFVRDEILPTADYHSVMWQMIQRDPAFDLSEVSKRLWMGLDHLETLIADGHLLGLHSHTHPTRMDLLSLEDQTAEYRTNFRWLENALGAKPSFVAHPCGRYNDETLDLLAGLNIRFGFRSTLGNGVARSLLEIPREDSANLLRSLNTGLR